MSGEPMPVLFAEDPRPRTTGPVERCPDCMAVRTVASEYDMCMDFGEPRTHMWADTPKETR